MEEKSSSCWRLIRVIPERKRLPVRRCALLQEEVHVEPRVAIGAAPSSAPNADEHLRPSLVAFQPPKQIPSELLDRSGPSSVPPLDCSPHLHEQGASAPTGPTSRCARCRLAARRLARPYTAPPSATASLGI